jgi:uncharacterized protein
MVYINVIANVSASCDCSPFAGAPFVGDIGILVSTDIVAIDKASMDLVDAAYGGGDAFAKESGISGSHQLTYAAKLGMGNLGYNLIDIDKK